MANGIGEGRGLWRKEKNSVVRATRLSTFEKEDGYLSEVEVDEVPSFVCHVTSEVATNDAMPRGIVLFVKFLLHVGCDVLENE